MKGRLAAVAAAASSQQASAAAENGADADAAPVKSAAPEEDKKVAKPDVTQMIPFKPKLHWRHSDPGVPGGDFPYPPAVEVVLRRLPPPHCYQGPDVMIDKMMHSFAMMPLPDEFEGK